jgi:uncharacterized RDD family membrane protein YckC
MAVFYIFCWVKFAGTPGKRLLRLKLLDEKTGKPVTVGQGIIRYIGYLPSTLVLFIGLIWIAFDSKNKVGMTKWQKVVVESCKIKADCCNINLRKNRRIWRFFYI